MVLSSLYDVPRNFLEVQSIRQQNCDVGRFCRSAAVIGRQLAVVGDDINNRYAPEFSQMIRMLNLTPETAYEAFAGVARKYAGV